MLYWSFNIRVHTEYTVYLYALLRREPIRPYLPLQRARSKRSANTPRIVHHLHAPVLALVSRFIAPARPRWPWRVAKGVARLGGRAARTTKKAKIHHTYFYKYFLLIPRSCTDILHDCSTLTWDVW